ncbi:MAG TPA: magnesium transporter [Candidatus Magasanikbacteria bacterium]|nr:magnesium transporter [Candidatus Magasanikbacteria bacterium]
MNNQNPNHNHCQYADDDYESIGTLFKLRAPALMLGLMLGIGISFVTSNFEEVLLKNVQLAFFLPFVVYVADAIGTQTEAIYSRDLKTGKADFSKYLHKEFSLGVIFGLIFGIVSGVVTLLWLRSNLLSLTVSIASFVAIATAPVVALLVAHAFQSANKDPAAGTGPIATVIQDMLSVVIFGLVANLIIL